MNSAINFSHNWNNKLLCIAFTTIRLRNDQKYQPGMVKDITYNGEIIGLGKIISIRHFLLNDLTEMMAQVDTGYDVETTKGIFKKMYPTANWERDEFSFILIRMPDTKVRRYIIPTQQKLTDKATDLHTGSKAFYHMSQTEVAAKA